MFSKIIFKIFTQNCIFCNEKTNNFYTSPVCKKCFNSLEIWGNSCIKCGKRVENVKICGECLDNNGFFDYLFHLYSYEGKAKEIINLYKFKGAWYFAEVFSEKIYEILKSIEEEYKFAPITFVPAHPYRIFTRNYNPVEYLTKKFCKKYNKIFLATLKKFKFKKPQTSLNKKEREKNVKGTFKLIEKELPEKIIIIDDIYTTGATLTECAKVLKKAGVQNVTGITLARA